MLNFYMASTNRQDGPSVFLEKDVKVGEVPAAVGKGIWRQMPP